MKRFVGFTLLFVCLSYAQGQQPEGSLGQLQTQFVQKANEQRQRVESFLGRTGLVERKEEFARTWQIMDVKRGIPMYYITDNLEAATIHKNNQLWPGGSTGFNLTGNGVNLGIWDAGKVRDTHQEFYDGFSSRVTQIDGATSLSNHATHVAGTLAATGVVSSAKGMSYLGQVKAYDWNSDIAEMTTAAAGGLKVSQHSYGYITGWAYGSWSGNTGWHWFGDAAVSATEDYYWGFYSDQAKDWDQLAYNAPNYLIVKSAGNDRGEGPAPATSHYYMDPSNSYNWASSTATRSKDGGTTGYDCVSHASTAKNVLTIGAVTSTSAMSTFSGWGPTDDGRIKPDLVAKGVNVYSPVATNNTAYSYYNGTSMSGPVVSGSVGLLLHHQENLHPGTPLRAATIKGLLIHSADDMVSGAPGPDYRFGWGMLDTQKAAEIMYNNASTNAHIKELTLNNSQTIRFPVQATGSQPLRITCSWTDVPGVPPTPSLNPTTPMLVNDLDIRLTDAEGNQYYPYILNPSNPSAAATTGDNTRDNVEMIHLASAPAGKIYFLTVTHKGTLSGGSQAFSLIITGNQAMTEKNILGSFDQASNYSSWTNGSNQGDGFEPWELVSGTNTGGSAGFFIGDPAIAGISGMSTQSFGLFANPANLLNFARADRKFSVPLPVGATLSFKWGVNWDSDGIGNKGFNLYSNNTQIINVNIGGSQQISINSTPMFNNYGTQAITFNFKMESPTQLRVTAIGRDGSESYDVVHTVSGAPDAIRFYASGLAAGVQRQPYFDQLTITSDPTVYAASETVTVKGKVSLNNTLNVKNIIVESNNQLIIPQGKNATASTHIYNSAGNSGIIIQSNASGNGSLLHYNSLNATMQRYIPGSIIGTGTRYHQVSVPLAASNNPLSGLFLGSHLFEFDADANSWTGLGSSTNNPLNVARGYMIWYTGASTTYQFAGTLNNGNFSALIASTAADRFNLVPNPYPSAIDWDAASGWTKTNLYNAIYIWNRNTGNYASYIAGVGTNGGSRYIAPGQSFFVKTTSASAALAMNDNVRLHNHVGFLKSGGQDNLIRISSANAHGSDEIIIRFMAHATDDLDPALDAEKLEGALDAPQLASILENGKPMSINSLNSEFKQNTIPLSFFTNTPGTYTLHFESSPSVANAYIILLEDLLLNQWHIVNEQPNYAFEHQPGNPVQRFILHLTGITRQAEKPSTGVHIWQSNNILHISRDVDASKASLRLMDAAGRLLGNYQLETARFSLPISNKGLIIVELKSKEGVMRKKLIF